jgi:hypothetical protein
MIDAISHLLIHIISWISRGPTIIVDPGKVYFISKALYDKFRQNLLRRLIREIRTVAVSNLRTFRAGCATWPSPGYERTSKKNSILEKES